LPVVILWKSLLPGSSIAPFLIVLIFGIYSNESA
jgi:hypothetical protein